jgi:hypothetical protein
MKFAHRFHAALRDWEPPRELRHAAPRDVRFSGGGLALAIAGILAAAGGLIASIFLATGSLRQTAEYEARRNDSQETEGRVLRKWYRRGENRRHFVEYEFDANGRSFRNEAWVHEGFWKRTAEGGAIRVAYRASQPETNWLAARPGHPLSLWAAVAVWFAGLGFAALIGLSLRRQMRLLAEGRVTPGVVTRVRKVHHNHGANSLTVSYEFALLNGAVAKGKGSTHRKGLDAGSVVSVLYDPDNVRRSALYPFELVKVAKDR